MKKEKKKDKLAMTTVTAQTVVQMPLVVENLNENQRNGLTLARELAASFSETQDKYRAFCMYARQHLLPKECSDILTLAGIRPDVASRIKLVACVLPQGEFDNYMTGQIGFKASVELARDAKETSGAVGGRGRGKKSLFPKLISLFEKMTARETCSKKNVRHYASGHSGAVLIVLERRALHEMFVVKREGLNDLQVIVSEVADVQQR